MTLATFMFEGFHLDPANRWLRRGDQPIELSGRYLDALILLVCEHGRLVSKDRFLQDVWGGAPVTDEALTQCIRSIRKQLGDDAGRPRFIETVPKHGYRFIAPVIQAPRMPSPAPGGSPAALSAVLHRAGRLTKLTIAAAAGGASAGALGGLLYGFGFASQQPPSGVGAASVILILVVITGLVGFVGGAGVGLGVAVADLAPRHRGYLSILGGGVGGLTIGALAKLIGLDAFDVLLGLTPGEITGAAEGLALGGAVGMGAWLSEFGARAGSGAKAAALAAWIGGAAGIVVALCGGHLMGGSLNLLAGQFPTSHLNVGAIGKLFGDPVFGPLTQGLTAGLEGALFSAGVVGMRHLARRALRSAPSGG